MGGKEEIAKWGLGSSTSVGETTAQAFQRTAGRGDRNLIRHPSVMFARDQFLNRVGIAGVRNSSLILNNITPAETRLLSRTCRYQKTAEAYARATFLEAQSIALRYRIDSG
jgi:hypothetical protein